MKRAMISMLILAVLSLWTPIANAENTQDLDPMVSPEAQTTMTSENSTATVGNGQVSEGVTVAPTTTAPAVEKKMEEAKKGKSKKSDKKKLSEKKSEKKTEKKAKKTSSKSSKKHKKSSNAQ